MRVILFGATGMLGQGVLRECLLDDGIEAVLSVGRSATGRTHPKLREILQRDLFDLRDTESELAGFDACLFCLGVSSAGMSEANYRRITYDLTVSVATALVKLNAGMTFLYVSGMGADSTERGRVMWARIKGETENALLGMPFRSVYILRPAAVLPRHGVRSRTRFYRWFYAAGRPVFALLERFWPGYFTTTEQFARAMIRVARHGAPKKVLESRDLRGLALTVDQQ